jgi:ribosome-associated protein
MSKSASPTATPKQLAVLAARTAADSRCTDVVVLDLGGISPVTDYFVIATGTSDRQLRSVADEIAGEARKVGHRPYHSAGRESAQWVLLDFVDVVVHLFDAEHRGYYDLELIWGDAPRVKWQRATRRSSA